MAIVSDVPMDDWIPLTCNFCLVKLKIRAMSSESKASAYIIGVLPFMVFGLIYYVNSNYMGKFFIDQRLMVVGLGGMVWMAIGAFVMSQMIDFEI